MSEFASQLAIRSHHGGIVIGLARAGRILTDFDARFLGDENETTIRTALRELRQIIDLEEQNADDLYKLQEVKV